MHEASRNRRLRRRAGECHLTGEHLVEHAPECEQIGASVERLAGRLLRTHVRRRADRKACLRVGARRLRCRNHRPADAEIRHHSVPLMQQHVVRLDVAMDDVVAMRVVERVRDFARQPDRVLERQTALAREPRPERLALDEGHREEQPPVHLARIVERQDVWMGQSGRQADLAKEAFAAEGTGELEAKDLERDVPVVAKIARAIHDGHAAFTEHLLEAIGRRDAFGKAADVGLHDRAWSLPHVSGALWSVRSGLTSAIVGRFSVCITSRISSGRIGTPSSAPICRHAHRKIVRRRSLADTMAPPL